MEQFVNPPVRGGNHTDCGVNTQTLVEKLHEKTTTIVRTPDINLGWKRLANTLTGGVSVLSPDPWFPWTFLALLPGVPWVSSSSGRRLFREGFGSGVTASGICSRTSRSSSLSRSSFRCLARVLLTTSRPPLQRMGHVHQAIGRSQRWVDINR